MSMVERFQMPVILNDHLKLAFLSLRLGCICDLDEIFRSFVG